jgi:hypothetical protein
MAWQEDRRSSLRSSGADKTIGGWAENKTYQVDIAAQLELQGLMRVMPCFFCSSFNVRLVLDI